MLSPNEQGYKGYLAEGFPYLFSLLFFDIHIQAESSFLYNIYEYTSLPRDISIPRSKAILCN